MKLSSDLIKYLNSNDILIEDKKNQNYNSSFNDKICHINNLVKIQKTISTYSNPYSLGLSSLIWEDIEIFKMWNRRGRKIIKDYNLKELETIVSKAEESIDSIYKIPYLDLIHRAMNNNEICIRRTSQSNIWKDDKIKIVDVSKIGFNLIEHDCYKYLFRFRKQKNFGEFDKIIDYFVESQNLDENSKIYIKSLLAYPYDSMKVIQKEYLEEHLNKEEMLKKYDLIRNFYNDSLI